MMVMVVVMARDHVAPVTSRVMPARRVVAVSRRMMAVMVGPGRGDARGHGQGQARGEREGHELQGPVFSVSPNRIRSQPILGVQRFAIGLWRADVDGLICR
jgi:hypothetical protein